MICGCPSVAKPGKGDEIGTIEAGKIADLLGINGDPIRDIGVIKDRTRLDIVMKGGEFIESRLIPSQVSKVA